MPRILKKFFLVLLMTLSFNISILAKEIECNYSDAGLTISYDKNNKISYSSDFIKSEFYYKTILVATSASPEITKQIEIDQDLWKKYMGNNACPSGLKVCAVTSYSFDLPTLKSLGAELANEAINFILVSPFVSDELKKTMKEEAYSAIHFNERKLYVLTKEEYDKSEIKKYPQGNSFTNTQAEGYAVGYNFCADGKDTIGAKVWGTICGEVSKGWTTISNLFAGDIKLAQLVNKNCQDVAYNGPYISFNANCGQLSNKEIQYLEEISKYKKCGEDTLCKSKSLSNLNKIEDNIKLQCSSILQNHDYEGVQKECIDKCFNIKDTLNEYRKNTDLYDDGTGVTGKCGFSDRLTAWILNIVKWVKYIIPAIVIILGILDFIKAIASDKDDEMKKAQGRFIKRLIAAALIFIIPFIIEFALDKMGFAEHIKGCGVTDLF